MKDVFGSKIIAYYCQNIFYMIILARKKISYKNTNDNKEKSLIKKNQKNQSKAREILLFFEES